ncbi:MAG: DegV family protein, partial [Pseudomonadota bacterium]
SKVSTSQASVYERHQHYQKVLSVHPRVLYLCVGSVFTGNYQVATQWKNEHDPDNRMIVLDTTAASGRLGIVALATARHATNTDDPESVISFARKAIEASCEFVFLDKLHYLAAGGRLSRTSAFFGDLLHMKPIVSPTAKGAKKVGVVHNQKEQISFALEKITQMNDPQLIMLEYSDNKPWVQESVLSKFKECFPRAEIILQPISLTSGAHMGPGTWAVATLPKID